VFVTCLNINILQDNFFISLAYQHLTPKKPRLPPLSSCKADEI
jgi:hypothetical protein